MTLTLSPEKVGPWVDHEILEHEQVNKIASELVKAIDGVGGGAYNPSANITLGGAGELRIDNVLRVLTGADLFVDTGGTITFNGQATFNGTTDFFGDQDFIAGGITTIFAGHDFVVQDLDDLAVDDDDHTYRIPLVPLGTAFLGGAPAWETGTPAGGAQWINASTSGSALLYFALPINAGDDLVELAFSVEGGAGSGHGGVDPTNRLRARFMEGSSVDAAPVSLSSLEDPATLATYDGAHTFFMNAASDAGTFPYTALDRQYVVELRAENGGTAATFENLIKGIKATITRRKLVPTNVLGGT